MKMIAILISTMVLAFLIFVAAPVQAESYGVTLPATANIYSAGLSVPVAPAGGGAGTLPFWLPIATGQTRIHVGASGSVSQYYAGFYHGPDGLPGYPGSVDPYGGLSGFITDQILPLAAVFLTDAAPQAPAPATLDFRVQGLGRDYSTLSPEVGQVFFVGDGQTSAGQTQTFFIPAGATRLFVGFPDSAYSQGLPGSYGDNMGSLQVSVSVIPEPSVTLLAGLALGMIGGIIRVTCPGGRRGPSGFRGSSLRWSKCSRRAPIRRRELDRE